MFADPAKRLQLIKASVQESKARLSQMTPEEILNYTTLTLAPSGLTLLTGLAPQLQAFNVVISNVPGPPGATLLERRAAAGHVSGVHPHRSRCPQYHPDELLQSAGFRFGGLQANLAKRAKDA